MVAANKTANGLYKMCMEARICIEEEGEKKGGGEEEGGV
jgi:hypothetical protein